MARQMQSLPPKKDINNIVMMEAVSSNEVFINKNNDVRHVLTNITLSISKGEIWGMNGKSSFEIKLLLEIMANIKPYYNGRCVLVEQGMMRLKRIILPHVFYLGSPTMIYNNMNVLEYLMFATAHLTQSKVNQQRILFEFLIDIGLGNISLSPVHSLPNEHKAVILLLAGACSNSQLIIFNFPDYRFDEELVGAIEKIALFNQRNGNNLIVGTQQGELIEKVCTHTAFLLDGTVYYKGDVREFRMKHDKIAFTVRDQNAVLLAERMAASLPFYTYKVMDECVVVSNYGDESSDPTEFYQKLVEEGFAPNDIAVNPKTVENASEEIIRQHDLQK